MGRNRPEPAIMAPAIVMAHRVSAAAAARATGVPPRTVSAWLKQWRAGELQDAELQEQIGRLLFQYTLEAEEAMAAAVSRGAQLLRQSLDYWLSRGEEQPLTPGQMRDVSIVVGVLQDKLSAMEGRPSHITRHERLEGSLDTDLLDSYARPEKPSTGE